MRYFEAFSEAGFHSALLSTYAFGAAAFEDVVLPRLRASGCRNICVLADRDMANRSFVEFGPPQWAGRLYHLVKVSAPGAFHPKIALLIGESKGRLMVGSANLTAPGLAGNRELVSTLSSDDPGAPDVMADALEYLTDYVGADDPFFATVLHRARSRAPWLRRGDQGSARLLHDRPDVTILDQLADALQGRQVKRLSVLSPYWDERLEGLARLRTAFSDPPTDLLIDAAAERFPVKAFQDGTATLYDLRRSGERFMHAKLIVVQTADEDLILSGSINCSAPALLGLSRNSGNAEAGLLVRRPAGTALVALELDPSELRPTQAAELPAFRPELSAAQGLPARDGGALARYESSLVWRAPGRTINATALHLRGPQEASMSVQLAPGATTYRWKVDAADDDLATGEVEFSDKSRSAPITIVNLDLLRVSTLPAAQGRRGRLLDVLGEMPIPTLRIMEILAEFERDGLALEAEATHPGARVSSPVQAAKSPDEYRRLSYEEFLAVRAQERMGQHRLAGAIGAAEDTAYHLSRVLNRLAGILTRDGSETEHAFTAFSSEDVRSLEELQSEGDQIAKSTYASPLPELALSRTEARSAAMKFKQAVDAFTERCRNLADAEISVMELVRLRALLQIVMAHAQPLQNSGQPHQVLSVRPSKDGTDWPRLVGRLLLQHFSMSRILQRLTISDGEGSDRIVEYLAFARSAGQAARLVAQTEKSPLLMSLGKVVGEVELQLETVFRAVPESRKYFDECCSRFCQIEEFV